MQSLRLSIIVLIIALMSFSNQLSFAQETSLTQVLYQANLDKLNYKNTDILHMFLAGKPNGTVNLKILDHSNLKKFSDVIHLGNDGLALYSLNLTSYGPDAYFAILNKDNYHTMKLDFVVNLAPSKGYRVEMNTTKIEFHLGDPIPISGILDANSTIHVTLTDPENMLQYSNTTQSDATGIFSTILHLPIHSTMGIWKIDAANDKHSRQSIILVHPSNQTTSKNSMHCCDGPVVATNMNSPLKQFKSGIALGDIVCKSNLQLIMKTEDHSPVCVKPNTASILLQRNGWTMVSSDSNNFELNNMSQNKQQNYLPNISQRLISMTIGGNTGTLSYLPIMVSDKIILEKPSNSVILQKLHPDWQNRKSPSNSVFEVNDENGNNIGASFFQQDTLGIESLGPSSDMMVIFDNPFNMPIKSIVSIATITYSMDEIGPTNSTYHLKFASLYPVKINLPSGIELVSNNTKTYSEFWTKDYSGNIISSNSTYIQYGDSKVKIQDIILYDMTFK